MNQSEEFRAKAEELERAGKLSAEAAELIREMTGALEEALRSNRALRLAAVKAAHASPMSSRLRDALLE